MMNLITEEWRLKLLAVGLAVLMLGAVAFSQANTRTIPVNILYNNLPSGLVLIAPIDKINVVVSGPSDLIGSLQSASITATADLTHLKKGSAISVPIQVRPTDLRIAVQSPAPITVNVDDLTSVELDVVVRTPNPAPGWQVTSAVAQCGNSTAPCQVKFDGPASVAAGLKAFVTVTDSIRAESAFSLNESVQFEQTNGHPLDLSKVTTLPRIIIDPSTVSAHVVAKRGTASVQVTLIDDTPSHYPPPGYRVTGVIVEPLTVLCTGPADAIGTQTAITLPPVDLSRATSNISFRVPIPPQGAGVTCNVAAAKVTYSISPIPNPSPSPTT